MSAPVSNRSARLPRLAGSAPRRGLSARAAEVLRDVVDAYLRSGEPVGSHIVAEHSAGGMSAATVRVVLSELADQGLLTQPHTSAGRVPTNDGLRVYVEDLMRPRQPSARARESLDAALRAAGPTPHEIVRVASEQLSEVCELAALGRRPRLEALRLTGLNLVRLGAGRTLAVVVFDDASIRHRVLEAEHDDADLVRVQNLVSMELTGLTVAAARARLQGDLREGAGASGLDARTRELTEQSLPEDESPDEAVVVCGRTHIVERAPSTEDLGDMLRVLDDKRLLLHVLDAFAPGEGVQVRVGDDASFLGLSVCAMVAAPYFVGEQPRGTVAIVGPVRMEYARVIPLVTYTARAISGIFRGAIAAA